MDLPTLSAEQFPAFFQAVQTWTGKKWDVSRQAFEPFPWQTRLAAEVVERGCWPDLLDLPTGSGKTAAIDIAVFHLALEADRGDARQAALRMAFVIDRRLVVDEAFSRAERLAAALQSATRPESSAPAIVDTVARRLQHLAGPGRPPLIARSLRGGAPREDDWARTPCQPTVLCSTVDQVGSRLLFRGYGVSNSMRPVQAGLLGSDALILLDEAHLSQPFRQTAQAIAERPAVRGPDAAPFQVALLTATPGETAERRWRFQLAEDDRSHRILAKRLNAAKPVTLYGVGSGESARSEALAEQALKLVNALQADGVAAPVVGVIANRVGRARAAFERLTAELGGSAEAMLVIGRARSVDRNQVANRLARIKTGADPRPDKTLVIVATQTLEAGVDIDLDALVTDAASLDALRQRFGRVNRDGRSMPARGVILADKTDRKPKKDGDPIYGHAIAATLDALFPEDGATVDFGFNALNGTLDALSGETVRQMLSDKSDAPVLMPAYVDLWTHTAPIPSADPEVALFLHGPNREPASVQLVWRADVDETLDPKASAQSDRLRALMAVVPPRTAEAIELPVWAVRRWLLGEARLDLGDVAQAEDPEMPERASESSPAFCWRGADDDRSRIVAPNDIRPGDMIVVPSSYGGCDEYGWRPSDTEPTIDVYVEASEPYEGKHYVVRVAPGLIRQLVFAQAEREDVDPSETAETRRARLKAKADRIAAEVAAALTDPSARADDLAAALADIVPGVLKEQLQALKRRKVRLDPPIYPYGGEDGRRTGVVLRAPFGLEALSDKDGDAVSSDVVGTEDDESGSFIGRAQSLVEHSCEVEALARQFAERAGLAAVLVDDLALAGWLHDAGKADLRFQRLLFNGDLLAMDLGQALAKSDQGRSPPGAWARARLPERWRHEALSVRLALENPSLLKAHDRALVLWLVGVHHGHGRPFFPHADPLDEAARSLAPVDGLSEGELGAGAGPQSLGFVIEGETFGPTERDPRDLRGLDWATMFRDLKRRYGAWGLARFEAVLRLADHRASETARDRKGRT
jgi:CRISPR-associated endonuclease/helicase Cas3